MPAGPAPPIHARGDEHPHHVERREGFDRLGTYLDVEFGKAPEDGDGRR